MTYTKAEWDARCKATAMRLISEGHDAADAMMYARHDTELACGPEPAGPPLWLRLVGPLMGVTGDMLTKVWDWLNGKKTNIGLALSALTVVQMAVVALVPIVSQAFPAGSKVVVWTTGTAGLLTTVVGLAHKAWKRVYGEEHA